ncbi:tail fiber protein [Citrobacter farmeri]|uniref:tail fiber protein n=1 Tax=Citrobacter farmeri TaxID=67824 RepID=UPI0018A9D84F|nr:tail fiber protein [Citrobacter farmeri]MDB2183064.1 phage tail protein [Citrobacter farmeri]
MALTLLAANNAQTVLAAGINATATTLTVNTGTGNLFPSPVSGTSFFKLTLVDSATGSLSEIVHVTSRTGDTMTIERAQEGTTARIWSANDIAANMLTAGSLQLYAQKDQSLLISNNLSEIADAGPDAVAQALSNLRLGAGAPPIGIPFFWPLAVMPNTVMDEWSDMLFLKANGSSFSAATYPKLAKVWTGLVIPDMRGEFLRIRDDGRGVDAGRALLSAQAGAAPEIVGAIDGSTKLDTGSDIGVFGNSSGAFSFTGTTTTATQTTTTAASATRNTRAEFRASRSSSVYGGASEIRPRNIAFDFLVRAK